MKTSRYLAPLTTSLAIFLATSVASQECWAVFVYFDGSTSTDFLDGTNWTPATAPGTNLVDTYSIDDGLTATISGETTTIFGLRVGSAAKEHTAGEIHSGRLNMTGGTLEVIGVNTLAVGRENQSFYPIGGDYNKDTVVDAADYTVWRNTLDSMSDLRADGDDSGTVDEADYLFWKARYGNVVRGGGIVMSGDSILRTNGALIGERTKGVLDIGPNAIVEVRIWDTAVVPNQFGGTEDMRIGGYGPVFDIFGAEPGLDGNGLVDVKGALTAKDLYISEHGARGELRVSGGEVNLNGSLIMDFCGGCGTNPVQLAKRSSKVTMVGSGGTFNVGLDPDPLVVDPMPPLRDIKANSTTATFTFIADAGGVTPIVIAENVGETSGNAYIDMAKLVLDLNAYTSAAPITLIDAPAAHLFGAFGSVTFLGNRTATVQYDYLNGNVNLIDFQGGAGSGGGSLAGTTVPEPSGPMLLLTVGLLLFTWGAGARQQRVRLWGVPCRTIRA